MQLDIKLHDHINIIILNNAVNWAWIEMTNLNCILLHTLYVGWLHGTVVERQSVTGKLSLYYARPAADGWPVCG